MFHTGGDCAACQPLLFPTKTVKGVIIHGLLSTKVFRVRKLTVNVEISQTMLFDRFIRFPIKNTSAYAGKETYAEFGRKSLLILASYSPGPVVQSSIFKKAISWINVTFDSSLMTNR